MRLSKMYVPTVKESPSEVDSKSYQILLKSGMVRKLAVGTYSYLPLGYKVVKKIENIIRKEMNRIDSQETLLPIILPSELWEKSGRWEKFGAEMFKLQDRHGRAYCLAPTHEEAFTNLIKNELNSYKQLPLSLYQIQNKYRDEIRPRFGLIRGREFIMKDAYTFNKDEVCLEQSYKEMWEAYSRIFKACGIECAVVEGDAGAMGGSDSHEFIALAETGESKIFTCEKCHYAATEEKVEVRMETTQSEKLVEMELVHTPEVKTISDLSAYLDQEEQQLGKSLAIKIHDKYALILIPGHRDLDMIKLTNYLGVAEHEIAFATDAEISEYYSSHAGFMGPVKLKKDIRVIIDKHIECTINMTVGANKEDYHIVNVNCGRDFDGYEVAQDLLEARDGDVCIKCGGNLVSSHGDEVGNIFKLGTKYSEALGATYLDEHGKSHPFVMGSYGIGVSRTLAAIIDQHADERGMVWPAQVAPFTIQLITVNVKDKVQVDMAENLYASLKDAGIEVLIDDRKTQAGKKFADADLIGCPYRITVGRLSKEGKVEVLNRITGESKEVDPDQVLFQINN